MRKKCSASAKAGFLFLLVLIIPFWVSAQGTGSNPIAVSPGGKTEAVTVSQSCPTFSWSSVDQAASYRIAVFQSFDAKVMSYEDMATMSSPVISNDISGPALSWTLSAEESLQTGNIYIWYVQAVDSYSNPVGLWSNGKIFKVEQEIAFAGIEGKMGEILKSYGVSDQVITNAIRDLKDEVKDVKGQGTVGTNVPERSGVLGYEGANNTYYGLNAGYSNTTGSDNSFIGTGSGQNNTTGICNSFLGSFSGFSNTTGNANSFVGNNAGNQNKTGYFNSFLGYQAGFRNTTGNSNSFLGVYAGYGNTIGNNNSFVGRNAGYNNSEGSGNTFLGYSAGYNETGSNKLYIANSDTTSPLIYGEFDNSIVMVNGKLGINTKTPGYTIEANTTGSNAGIAVKRTDGATAYMNATTTEAQFGSVTNLPVKLYVNSAWKMLIKANGKLRMSSGATCTIGGVWTNASSRALKENIETLNIAEALDTLTQLNPVKYNYKNDKTDKYVGFIAEDVPELVATSDRKGLSPIDITAVLTKVVQEQQNVIQELQKENQEYKKIIAGIENRMAQLEQKRKP